jgi:peptide/nickel transport system permease protein
LPDGATGALRPVPPAGRSRRALAAIRRLGGSPAALIGGAIVLFWVAVALLADVAAPYDPAAQLAPFAPPGTPAPDGGVFWLGTDNLGRDVLSRIVFGARIVLVYATAATLAAYAVGVSMGLAAGYWGGWVDEVLSRTADLVLSFPILVLYIVVITTFGASGLNIVLAVVFASSPGVMRLVRGLTLDLRHSDYVAAAAARGEGAPYILFVEILPNARGVLIVDACLRLGYTAITIGVLGFFGLGLPPPQPDWGGMISSTRSMATFAPHMAAFPALAISSLVLGLNLLADGLRTLSLRD